MKKYIQPKIEIEKVLMTNTLLAGTDPQAHNQEGDGEASNTGFFDDPTGELTNPKGLWDD